MLMRLRFLTNLLLTTLSVWVVVSILKHLDLHPPRPPTPPAAPVAVLVAEPVAVPSKPLICVITGTTARGGVVGTHLVRSVASTCEFDRFDYALHISYDADDPYFTYESNRTAYASLAAPVPVRWLAVENPSHKPGFVFNAISAHAVASGYNWIYRVRTQ